MKDLEVKICKIGANEYTSGDRAICEMENLGIVEELVEGLVDPEIYEFERLNTLRASIKEINCNETKSKYIDSSIYSAYLNNEDSILVDKWQLTDIILDELIYLKDKIEEWGGKIRITYNQDTRWLPNRD